MDAPVNTMGIRRVMFAVEKKFFILIQRHQGTKTAS